MTRDEIIEAQKEEINELRGILEKASEGPLQLYKVEAGPENGLYRCTPLIGGQPVIITAHPELNLDLIKKDTVVMASQYLITQILPEGLEVKEPPVEFDLIKWEEIGGIKSQIERIREAVEFPTLYAEEYKKFGLKPSKGVLLYGPTGVGKTMIAKAIASTILSQVKQGELQPESFIYLKGGDLLNPYVGVTEMKIKEIFEGSRRHFKKTGVRSVIFIDEAEAILPARGSRRSSDVETTIVPTFLSEMDGFEENTAFVILATNHPNQLDPAVIRPGRIDMKIEIARPTKEDCSEIFKIHLSKTKVVDNIDELSNNASEALYELVTTNSISGAYIANIVQGATLIAIKRYIADKKTSEGIILQDLITTIEENKE